MQELVLELKLLADDRQLSLSLDVVPVPTISADEQWLKQALINLLDNSLKYTPPGGSVTVQLRRSDDSLEIAVRDTGPGIEAEHVPFLFDRFYRVDKARARESGGIGLGLAIVKGIVEAHGGTVSVDTEPGKGSQFTIRLPLGRQPDSLASS